MTDARNELAKAIYNARNGRGALPFSRRDDAHKIPYLKDANAILSMLKLTPEAASALMDGTAVVVPVEPTGQMLEAADEANSQDWDGETDPLYISETTRCIYGAALAASPYRSNSDGG